MKYNNRAYSPLLLAAILSVTTIPLANAQTVPSTADIGRIGGESNKQNIPSQVQPPLNIKGNAPFTAPKGAEKINFILKEIKFSGVSAYSNNELTSIYADKIGKNISLADIYAIAANLTAKYRNDGYILTQVVVPPQTITDGIVNLQIVEGQIDKIKIDGAGAQGSNADIIKLYVNELKSKGVLNNKNLEKTILLINDLAGVTARSILSPSNDKTGMSDLTIMVERDNMDGNVSVNNYGSRYLGRLQTQGTIGLNSLLGYNERIEAQMAYAPSGQGVDYELGYFELRGEVPVGAYGTKFETNLGMSNTQPGHTIENLDVYGKSRFAGVKVVHPWVKTRELNISNSIGLDLKSVRTTSNVDINRKDDITALRIAGHTDFVDTLFSAAVTNANIEFSKGLSILSASDKGSADLSRTAGNPTFSKVTADVNRLERLANSLALSTTVKGQMSSDAQLSAEEFGIGGATSIGRGYDPSELVGDDGVAASVELQWSTPYQVNWLNSYTAFAFYDIGKVWNDDATSQSLNTQSLASAGLGVRTNITDKTHASIMLAKPLTHNVAAEGNQSSRLYLNLSHDF